jgi:hypothetical protein
VKAKPLFWGGGILLFSLPLLGESHHGGFAARKRMKIALRAYILGTIRVILPIRGGFSR